MRSLVSLPFFFAPRLSLFLSFSHHLSPSLSRMGTVPESGSENMTTYRQGQEAGTGCLARALAQALPRGKWGKEEGKASLKEFAVGGKMERIWEKTKGKDLDLVRNIVLDWLMMEIGWDKETRDGNKGTIERW